MNTNTSRQLNLPPTPLNRVGHTSPTHPKSLGDWRAMVSRAFAAAGLTQKEAAGLLDVTQSALSKQLAGLEHLSFWRMFSLPPEVWKELVDAICAMHGIQPPGVSQEDQELIRIGRAQVELSRQIAKAVWRRDATLGFDFPRGVMALPLDDALYLASRLRAVFGCPVWVDQDGASLHPEWPQTIARLRPIGRTAVSR
jgi:hypothetical protein